MQNSSTTHTYGCCISQAIPCLLENLKGDDNYKRLHITIWTQYSLYQYTNRAVCALCCTLQCTEEPSTHSYHQPNTNNPILQSHFFQTLTFTLSSHVSQMVPPVQLFSAIIFPSSLLYACYMPHMYYLPCYHYVNNIWWTVTVMKLTAEPSPSLYSYLPLTSNILLTPLLVQTINLWSSLHIRHQIPLPHKLTVTLSVL